MCAHTCCSLACFLACFLACSQVGLFVLNVPVAFFICLYLKLATVKTSLSRDLPDGLTRDQEVSHLAKKAFQLYAAGVSLSAKEKRGLKRLIKDLKKDYQESEYRKQLKPVDVTKLALVCETYGIAHDEGKDGKPEYGRPQIDEAARKLGLGDNAADLADSPPGRVAALYDKMIENIKAEEDSDGIFLSHYQLYGHQVMHLKGELERHCPLLKQSSSSPRMRASQMSGTKIWYDKDENPTEENMRLGVMSNKYFLLFLTKGVLLRPYCRKEIRWALGYGKKFVLVWVQDGDGAVASFNEFLEDCAKPDGQGDDGKGLTQALASVGIPYYADDTPFHAASMAQVLHELGKPPPAGFETDDPSGGGGLPGTISLERGSASPAPQDGSPPLPPPRVWLLYTENGKVQAHTIRDQLGDRWPGFTDQFFDLDPADNATGGGGLGMADGDVVLVYLAEGICSGRGMLRCIERAVQAAEVKVVWVVETETRHGWGGTVKKVRCQAGQHLRENSPEVALPFGCCAAQRCAILYLVLLLG
eukprot:SAG22_NODE_283_length_13027_cov_25.568535_2_plen_531_part_00